jgi:antitoxin (DNA-binding transcriptional repressor) of toxin-antitoxin stability system
VDLVATSAEPETVTLTDLRADTGRWVRRVASGREISITDHGVQVAVLAAPRAVAA